MPETQGSSKVTHLILPRLSAGRAKPCIQKVKPGHGGDSKLIFPDSPHWCLCLLRTSYVADLTRHMLEDESVLSSF